MIPAVTIVPKMDINGPDARRYDIRDTIYVSPSGKDGYLGGSSNLPKRTLFGVKEEIQKLKKGDVKNIKVEFLPGNYEASEFFFKDNKFVYFKHDENGTDDYKLTFKSFDKNNRAIFDNSKTYSGFVEDGNLWKVKVDEKDAWRCSFVGYVNNTKTIPARWPKYGSLAEYNTNTSNGVVYMRCLDSSSKFLSAVFDYYRQGGSLSNIGAFGTLDFRGFIRGTITDILSNLPNTTYTPGIFYIPKLIPSEDYRGINIYANAFSFGGNNINISNIDPFAVCTEKSENTIIKQGNDFWFYYKPSNKDINIGIENTTLKIAKHANSSWWFNHGGTRSESPSRNGGTFGYAVKTPSGYNYFNGENPDISPSIGFNIITPKNIAFENINMDFCVNPITLYTPSSSFKLNTSVPIENIVNEYSSNLTISGCHLTNVFSSGINIVRMNNAQIFKNFIYGVEGCGIRYQDGRDIVIDNNIIKSTNTVDTRNNGGGGHGLGNLHIYGEFSGGGHRSLALTGVAIKNNDFSYSGNIVKADTCRSLSAHNNKIYNAGFGCNSDMAALYHGFAFITQGNIAIEPQRNKIYNNIVYNSRAYTNNNPLGNLLYLDGTTTGPHIYNNIFKNGQTGIQHSSVDSPFVYNNVIYDTKICSITNKSNGGNEMRNVRFNTNIFVTGSSFNTTINNRASLAFHGWNGSSVHSRRIQTSPYYATLSSGIIFEPDEEDQEVREPIATSIINLMPIAPWKNKIRYSRISTGGTGTIREPQIVFNGSNWIIGTYNPASNQSVDGVVPRISSFNTSEYQNPWDVPRDNWINLNNSTDPLYTGFISIGGSATRRGNITTSALSSDNNLFWSLISPPFSNPETNTTFFKYGPQQTSFKDLSVYAAIPDPYVLNDNSLPSIFGDIQIMECNSILQDPLFIDPENFDFNLQLNSPAYNIGFQPIDTSNVGVYNTPDDPYWTLSATNLPGQPVINGHKDWSDYQTIPYPYNPLVEYFASQVD